jgi:hypothetical protein
VLVRHFPDSAEPWLEFISSPVLRKQVRGRIAN